ncbi:MAG TPA: response regulator [Tepidisphaeraceae bacterium]|nr:response regulator [Tepidisphaeraceae bacterium]
MSGENVPSMLKTGASDSFGVFTAIRDEQGHVIDFRVDHLGSGAEGSHPNGFIEGQSPHRLSIIPELKNLGLQTLCGSVLEATGPNANQFQWQQVTLPDGKYARIRAIRLGDRCFAQWRKESADQLNVDADETLEARLSYALKAAGIGVFTWNSETDQMTWSDGLYQLLGFENSTPGATLELWQQRVHADDVGLFREALRNSSHNGSARISTFRVVWPDKSVHYLECRARRLKSACGASDIVEGVVLDVTVANESKVRLKQSESNLRAITETLEGRVAERTREANARAEQLRLLALSLADAESRERKRLAQLLHDDLQQLVSAAKLKAGMARRMTKDDIGKESMADVERLLESALSASRSLSNELSPPVLHDAGLGAAVVTIARSVQQRTSLKINVQCDPRAEPELEQVRVLLFETIRELLNNIVQHAAAANTTITTSLTPDSRIEIRVVDDGRGFDVSDLWKPANRVDKPFGLLELRERLNYLGGDLTISSKVGGGTDVRIVMPVKLRELSETPSLPMPASKPMEWSNSHALAGRRGRLLVADDHTIFRDGLVNLLKHEPMLEVVGEAADGEETIELARSLQPDILLLDITMPKMSGVQVASQLSKEMPHLKIVGLSMHDRQDMASAMRAAGAVAYFTKGGAWEVLLSVLRSLVPREPAEASSVH